MSYGFEAININGDTIIGEGYSNHALYTSGSAETEPFSGLYGTTNYIKYLSFPFELDYPPLIGVRINPSHIYGLNLSPTLMYSDAQASKVTGVVFRSAYNQGPCYFDYFVFVPVQFIPNPTPEYGLQVFDESQNELFNSDYQYLRIKDVVTTPWTPRAPYGTNWEYANHVAVTDPIYLISCLYGADPFLPCIRPISDTQCQITRPILAQGTGLSTYAYGPASQRIIVCDLSP